MLRPWVPLIALALLSALAWSLGMGFLDDLGGCLLAAALGSELWFRVGVLRSRRRAGAGRRRALKRAGELDWSVIERSLGSQRVRRDCERPETLGVCTGRECLVYEQCDFNIKKPLG